MSFREKTAWITLVTVVACFGVYFGAILTGLVSPRGFDTLHLLIVCVLVLALSQAGLTWLAARLSRRDERAPADERERLIQLRSHSVGYYVLMALVLALVIPGHMRHGPIDLMNFVLFAVVAAVAVVAAAQIVMFRRDA